MLNDATNRPVTAGAGGTPNKRAQHPERFGGKGFGPITDVPSAADRSNDLARSGKAFGLQSRFEGHGSTYAERGTAAHTPGAGAYTPTSTRKSARKKSVVRLQAAFRGVISRKQSRGLFTDQLRSTRDQPGPGLYDSHIANTIARLTEPTAGEASSSSSFRDGTSRFEDKGSIYARAKTPGVGSYEIGSSLVGGASLNDGAAPSPSAWARATERAVTNARTSPGSSTQRVRSKDSADQLRAAAHRLLRLQHSERSNNDAAPRDARAQAPAPVQPPPRAAAPPPPVVSRPQPAARSAIATAVRALNPIDESQPVRSEEVVEEVGSGALLVDSRALDIGAKLDALKLSGSKKVRFSVGITVGSYEPLAELSDERLVSPVVSEGGTANGAYEPLGAEGPSSPLAAKAAAAKAAAARYSDSGTAVAGYDSFVAPATPPELTAPAPAFSHRRPPAPPGSSSPASEHPPQTPSPSAPWSSFEMLIAARQSAALELDELLAGLDGSQLLEKLREISAEEVDEDDYHDEDVWDVDGLKSDLRLAWSARNA
ncbi:hypothetical protein T492DRAFT_964586 [Pavlovales sp. CCMP2436]|nr:hypothetical protein T492DRAFT_964586 [Pavlovales sp. CCMP2436]